MGLDIRWPIGLMFSLIGVMLVVSVLVYFTSRHFDRKAGHVVTPENIQPAESDHSADKDTTPALYALIPLLPIVLILVFSPLLVTRISMDVVTAMLIGGILLLIGATTVFAELQDALDRIWRAPKRNNGGIWGLLRARVLSLGMIMGIGFLLMVSLVVSAVLAALGKLWEPLFAEWEILANVIDFLVSLAFTTTVFAMIYKIMPRVKVNWADVWIGAAVTALLFTLGKFLIGFYIGKSGLTSGFGAAGSLVVMLAWVYYSAQIFLMGAEFTWAYALTFGSRKEQPVPAAAPAVPSQTTKGQPDKHLIDAKQAAAAADLDKKDESGTEAKN